MGADDRCPDRRLFWRREVRARRRAGPPGTGSHRFRRRPVPCPVPSTRAGAVVAARSAATLLCLRRCGQSARSWRATASPTCSCWRSTSPRCWRDWTRAGATTTGAHIGDTREYLRRKLPAVAGPLARIRRDPRRRQAAPRPGGGRDPLRHQRGKRGLRMSRHDRGDSARLADAENLSFPHSAGRTTERLQ